MILKGAEIARYLARPDPTRPALLIYGGDAMRVALKRAEAVAALTGPEAEAEMRLTRIAGGALRKDAAGAILYAAEKAAWMAGEAIQCLGGNGYINDYPTGRLWRDAKLYEIGAGTSEIRRMLIGRELFQDT